MRRNLIVLAAALGCTSVSEPEPKETTTITSVAIRPSVQERRPSTHPMEAQINAYASSVQSLELAVQSSAGSCAAEMQGTVQQLLQEGADRYTSVVDIVRGTQQESYPPEQEFLNRTAGGVAPQYTAVPVRISCASADTTLVLRFVTPPQVRSDTLHLERTGTGEVHGFLRGGGLSASLELEELTNTSIPLSFTSTAQGHFARIGGNNQPGTTILRVIYKDGYVEPGGFMRYEIADTGYITVRVCERLTNGRC